jgi:hypothetical protein
MASNYRLQIVDIRDGEVVRWKAGAPIESDLVQELCDRLQKKGVGWFRSEAKVLEAVKSEFSGVVWDLKSKTIHNPDTR